MSKSNVACHECGGMATHRYVSTGEGLCTVCAGYEIETGYGYDVAVVTP